MSFSEWSNAKKKKKEEEESSQFSSMDTGSFSEWSNAKKNGSTISGYSDEAAAAGWKAFLASQEEKRKKEEEKSWFEKALEMLGNSGDSTLPGANITNVINAYRNDTSYREPSDNWSVQQRKDFGYLYSQDQEKAFDYAEKVNDTNTRAKKEEEKGKITEKSISNPVKHTIGALATAPMGLADYMSDLAEQVARGRITEKELSPLEYSQTVTGGISRHLNEEYGTLDEKIPVIGGKGWGDVYGLGTSIAQSSLAAAGGGQAGTLIQFFGTAASSGMDEAKQRGATDEQAIAYGTMAGAAEGLAEMIGVDNLFKIGSASTMREMLKSVLKQGAAEGIEEGLTSVMNNFADQLAMGDKSNFNVLVRDYMNKGWSEEEAKKQAWIDMAEDVAFDVLGGFVSGAVHAAPQTAYQTHVENRNYSSVYGESAMELVEQGLESKEGSLSHELAVKYQAKLNNGGTLTGAEINRLVKANEQEFKAEDMASIKQAAENRLVELGETQNTSGLAEILAKQATGQKLNRAERAAVEASKYGQRVANEMNTENVSSGGYSSNWARDIGTNRVNVEAYNDPLMTLAQEMTAPNAVAENASPKGNSTTAANEGVQSIQEADANTVLEATLADMGVNESAAKVLMDAYQTDTSIKAEVYAKGIQEAYRYGEFSYPRQELAKGPFSSMLTEHQRNTAYRLGNVFGSEQVAKAQAVVAKNATTEKSSVVGKVHFEGDSSRLTPRQSASISALETVADVMGVQIYVFESELNEAGQRVGANGWYEPENNSIHIDLHAGAKGEGTMLFTAAHELTHHVKRWSPEKFKTLADFLMQEYGEKGVSVEELVQRQIQKAKNSKTHSRELTYDQAFEEVIADSMESMLADGNVVEKLAKLKQQDRSLWEKIKDFISDLAKKIREVYRGMTPDSAEGRFVSEMVDSIEKLQELFTEALVDASENYRASEQVLAESGIAVDSKTDAGSIFSVRDVLSEKDRDKVSKALTERFDVTDKEAKEWLKAETSLASLILNPKYSRFLDYEADPNEVAIKQNSDYPQGTVDFSNICKKRREFTQVMNRVLRNFPNHVFAATDLARIRTIMGEEGMTLPCGICYVEDRRQLDTIVAQDFIEGLRLYREGSKTRPDGKPFNANQLKGLKLTDGDDYVPSIYELVTLEGRNSLKAKNPNMEAAWVRYNNARGMQAVRLLTNEAEYKRQILKYGKNTVKSKNDHGGLRIYSFSDMEMFHLIDIVQVITDSAAVGLKIQGYTKVNEYAKAVKDTGLKLNRSLIPKGDLGYHIENGRVVLDYDTVEGIDIHSKDFFDNRDNPNVGNITIGINDTQIRAAMVSSFVDQIIPFHTGQSEDVLGEKGIAAWDNYKDFQTEKDLATGKTSSHQVNIYTEVFQAAEEEGKPIQNKKQFVEKFLQVCKENGLKPRFAQFLNTDENGDYVYTEGYHKFLVDFKTFAQTEAGEYLPQMPVRPVFDDAYLTGLLEAYVEEQQAKDAEVARQMPKVIERITSEIIKPSEVKYSVREDMTEDERYEELKNRQLMTVDSGDISEYEGNLANIEALPPKAKSKVEKQIYELAGKLGILRKPFTNPEIKFEFQMSKTNGLKKSIHNQLNFGGSYVDFAKALINLDRIIPHAVLVEAHTKDRYTDTPRADKRFEGAYVLLGAFQDDDFIIPVKLEIKKETGETGNLYVVVAMTKIERTSVMGSEVPNSNESDQPLPVTGSIYSLQQIVSKINTQDSDFLKYIPDGMLSEEQVIAKKEAKAAEEAKLARLRDEHKKYSDRDTESVSNRSLLANAFEGVAQNEIEQSKIREYREKAELLDAQERKLQDLNRQIRNLSFAPGPKDQKKIQALRDEAIKTANRIGTYDRMLLNLEASKPLQAVLEREKKKAYQRAKQKHKQAMADYREKANKRQREIIDRYQASREKAIENREKTAARHKIQNVVKELNDLLLNESKKRHVPDSLKRAVADALALVNMDTVGAEERAAKYANLIARETDPDKIDAYTATMESILQQGEKMGQRLKELRDAYEEIQNSDDPDIANAYDPVIAGCLQELAGSIGNTSLRNMTLDQLSDVYDMYRMVLTRVRDANKSFLNEKKETISNLASRVVGEVRRVGGEHKHRAAILDPVKKFDWNNLKPVYAFERIGSSTLTEVFNGVRTGEDVWAKDVTEAREYYLDKSRKYGYEGWDFKKKYRFESDSGIPFELTLEQILSLYAYSKREQAHDHLRLGGFVFDSNIETYKDNKLIKYKVNTADAHQITPEILAGIIGKLTDKQKGFVDEMQDYLSTTMGAKGNEVTMAMYGVKLFKEKFYFPLKSARQFMFEQNEVSGEVKIKNSGFTNKTVAKANNPVILSNFMDVWTGHVNDMSMYHAFVLPLEDFNRIFNYNSPKKEGQPSVSVKGTIQSAYSPAAVSYVKQLTTDLNGGAMSDPRETIAKTMVSQFKKAKVMASMSVVIQQPSAIGRAFALVSPKYFRPTKDGMNHEELWNELKQYAPVAVIKEMGYFDTNMGMSTKDFITAKEYSSFKDKTKAVFTDSNHRDEVLSKFPALADELTWCAIWNAVKRETVSTHKDLSPRSEEFLKAAGKRFTEVVSKTQVYDSVLARSANMRSKSGMMNMATSFMAEPTTTINMLEDAIVKGNRGNKGYAAKAFASVATSIVFNNALVAIVYAMRDDDEDETYLEKYLDKFVSSMLDDVNPLTYYPFLKDMWSVLQGYNVERSDMSLVSDVSDSAKKLIKEYTKEDGDIAGAWWELAGTVANIGGIPVQNLRREINAVINSYNTIQKDLNGRKFTPGSVADTLQETVRGTLPVIGWLPGESKTDKLYDAIVSDDTAYVNRLKSGYKDESAVNTAIRTALRGNDPRIKEAAQAKFSGDLDEYLRIAKEIIGEKHFSQDNVVAAINAEINAMDTNESSSASKAKGMFVVEDFGTAVVRGNTAMANAIKTDIIRTAQTNGKTSEEAEKSFNSSAKSELKELFQAGEITEQKAISALTSYCGVENEDAKADVQYWAFKQKYPNTYADDSWFDTYYEKVADSGIGIDVYMNYRNSVTEITGEGKKERRMAVINSLPISSEQKDALYFAEGWTESKLWEAPWR